MVSPRVQKSGCGDTYQLIRDLNIVLVGIVASYFLEVMRSSEAWPPSTSWRVRAALIS